MTAEIAVMNRHAVALAADSAVTITTPGGQKIFNTVNKLFTLSKYQPIGVMIHGSADLNGVPWELLVKLYRREIGTRVFATVEEAAVDFLRWLPGKEDVFPGAARREAFEQEMRFLFGAILDSIDQRVKAAFDQQGEISEAGVVAILGEVIAEFGGLVDGWGYAEFCDDSTPARVLAEYGTAVPDSVAEVFQNLPLSVVQVAELERLAGLMPCKDHGLLPPSGIVIAGFGETQPFPALVAFDLDYVTLDFVKCARRGSANMDHQNTATIFPFAQREMVDTFVGGIDPSFTEAIDSFVTSVLTAYPDEIMAVLPELDPQRQTELRDKMLAVGADVMNRLREELEAFKQERFVGPIVASVGVLPKDELAEMAEALVNLTSFKRRMSIGEVETVGGPIDVAVISKGDGFIWMKRKHYFDPAKNPQFVARYFDDDK